MHADQLITGIAQLVTAQGPHARRGAAMSELHLLPNAAIAISNGRIAWVGPENDWHDTAKATVDLQGAAVLPGLIDPHTHAVWAGNRLADFEARARGATYEEMLAAGGGIRSTVRSTAAAPQQELIALATPRIAALVRSGATTIEIKSGYGFSVAAELAMLEAIAALTTQTPARILATLLIHIPPTDPTERRTYIEQVCTTLIPIAAQRHLASAVDVFIEREAWHCDEAETIFACAQHHGLAIKLHSDQFHSIGGVELGIRMRALSVDHLEAAGPTQINALAASNTIATVLPGVSLHLGIPAANGRSLIDAGAAVAVATDLNPGSSPLFSTAAALALAVRSNGLTPQEALTAGTINAACALGLHDRGRLEPGCLADLLVLHSNDWRDLLYTLGANPVREVWIGGRKVQPGGTKVTT